ncbi:hypothetical protein LXT21_22230 [Myxococcus sp. K38C18041901]|uniref:hypothetical protein n=1 Tax=Myxococcus guangdongensis TaxID=2906760 RepID=UPI0020A7BB9D|nr:hypothetical protein [Myxococcus guangdongensis]MCP3061507.1 hypothetical protein [Myxococcus guangdongensis]
MKKLPLGALLLAIPGMLFLGQLTYATRAQAHESLEPQACTFHYFADATYTTHVLTLTCGCGESACSETEDVTPYVITECNAC